MYHWKAILADGSEMSDATGQRYADIPRDNMIEFAIVGPRGPLFGTHAIPQNPSKFRYRRRTTIGQEGQVVYLVAGWEPFGPAWAVDTSTGKIHTSPNGFDDRSPIFRHPEAIAELGER